jgi:SNF2 family DNA or RNA helicase
MRLLLTGTPLQNSLGELWALLHYLLPHLFSHLMDFKAWFSRPFKGIPGLNEFEVQLDGEQEGQVIDRMHSLLAPFLLQRLKAEVLSDKLPPRVEATVRIGLSDWQRAAYADLERRTIKLLDGDSSKVNSEQINNALMQLRKIVLHPYLFQERYGLDDGLIKASGKLEALDRILTKLLKFEHKVLVFSQFTTVLDILQDFLKWRGIVNVRLDGQVDHEARTQRIQRFSTDPTVQVFLLSARAGGLGLNLQAADTVILFDLDWNPQNDRQAVARTHRVGQTREVRVLRLVTDSAVERHMELRCKEKLEMEAKIMGAGMFRRTATGDQRRNALRAVLGVAAADSASVAENVLPEKAVGSTAFRRNGSSAKAVSSSKSSEASVAAAASVAAEEMLALTSPEELNVMIARGGDELAAFKKIDDTLLRPRKGANKDAPLLVRCGRLMSAEEVPKGFTGPRDNDR